MSVVAELLQSTGKLAKENIFLKVDDLRRKFEDIQLVVQESLKNKCVEFNGKYREVDLLIANINDANSEYEMLYNYVEKEIKPQMVNSVDEYNDVVEDLKKAKELKELALNLSLKHKYLETAKSCLEQRAFLKSVINLRKFQALNDIESDQQTDIDIACSIRTEFIITKENIIYNLESTWHEKIIIESALDRDNKFVSITIDNTAGFEELEDNSELLSALKLLKHLGFVLKQFGRRFISVICETVIVNAVALSKADNPLKLTINLVEKPTPEPSEVLDVLKEILSFLYDGILQSPVILDEENIHTTGMKEFGLAISEELSSIIIDKCLKSVVPKQSKSMPKFQVHVNSARNFYNSLQDLGFFTGTSNLFINFIHDVDVLPVTNITEEFLNRSRIYMKQGLHQTVTVGTSHPSNQEIDTVKIDEITDSKNGLSASTFFFPQCQVSICIKELCSILKEIKDEAMNMGPVFNHKLYYLAHHICELYLSVVPVYHKKEIATIPQISAIFHNNCLYLAHFLCTLGNHFETDLKQEIPFTFVDFVPDVRKLGLEVFLTQLRQQKLQLLELLKEACASGLIDDGIQGKTEKAVRQCLCQLQLLKKVWAEVLPIEVYFKAIGILLNTCLEEVIVQILKVEDIAADAAAQLDSSFDIFIKQGPELFLVSSTDKRNLVDDYVKKWFKFQELQIILNASLLIIVERWSSGKGPLATHFTAEEVKHLIRALFQNTERRATALAKIR